MGIISTIRKDIRKIVAIQIPQTVIQTHGYFIRIVYAHLAWDCNFILIQEVPGLTLWGRGGRGVPACGKWLVVFQ